VLVWANTIGHVANVMPLHLPDNSEVDAIEQLDPERLAFGRSTAPLLRAAVTLQAAA
jgi:hypothetical protein